MPHRTRSPRRRAKGDEGSGCVQLAGEHRPDIPLASPRQTACFRIVHRRDGLAVIVQLELIDGEPTIDLRLWRRDRSGVRPTVRGFRLGLDQANELTRALQDVIAADATGFDPAEVEGNGADQP